MTKDYVALYAEQYFSKDIDLQCLMKALLNDKERIKFDDETQHAENII